MSGADDKAPATAPGGAVPVSMRFDVRYLKDGEHTLVIPISDAVADLMGRIVILWGGFELRMDLVIAFMLKTLGREEPKGWKRRSFSQRKELFQELMATYTTKLFPSESATFERLVTEAIDLQWQRNTIAHGYIKGRSQPDPTSATGYSAVFYAVGKQNGKEVMIDLDEPTLERLRHAIAHLGGNLMAAIHRMGGHIETESPEIVIADKEFLQGHQSGSLRTLPVSKTPEAAGG
jgi:hypothetical protein